MPPGLVMREDAVRPVLSDVTLVAVSSVAVPATVTALEASMQQACFAEVLLLSDRCPRSDLPKSIKWRRIKPLTSRAAYSRFMLRDLVEHIRTSHALCVQWDGFVLKGAAWDSRFLDYDYIGAVWPQFSDGHNVGNGGFSLRSRRLLEACREIVTDDSVAEDVSICRLFRATLEEAHGMRFAPEAIARRFAFERTRATGAEFGFHGVFNLVRHLSSDEAVKLVRSLEPGVLSRREHLELLRWAVARGRGTLALSILSRLRSMKERSAVTPLSFEYVGNGQAATQQTEFSD